jgi:integrase
MGEESVQRTRNPWSTRKKDSAPRGVYRHPSGKWAVRYTCGGGHIHKEKTGSLKSEAERIYHERRNRAQREPGWCPAAEMQRERQRVRLEIEREKARITFRDYAKGYLDWAKLQKRSWTTDRAQLSTLLPRFGDRKLDEVSTADVERFRDQLAERRSRATVNRYLALLSAMYSRAVRLGFVKTNPAKGVTKFRENNQRVMYLTAEEEAAICSALPTNLQPLFVVSINTGLRWSEQLSLKWKHIDPIIRIMTVARSKHGQARTVPMNSTVQSVLVNLASQRQRLGCPDSERC